MPGTEHVTPVEVTRVYTHTTEGLVEVEPAPPEPPVEMYVVTWRVHEEYPERRLYYRTKKAAEDCMFRLSKAASEIEVLMTQPPRWHVEELQ